MLISDKSDSNSPTRFLGIGGYYSIINVENVIESGKYETMLSLISLGNRDYFQPLKTDYSETDVGAGETTENPAREQKIKDFKERAKKRAEKRKQLKEEETKLKKKLNLANGLVGFATPTVIQGYKTKIQQIQKELKELGGDE